MIAALVSVSIDPAKADPTMLTTQVVPMVKAAPGFVAGYWMEPNAKGESIAVVMFDTEEHARAAAPPVGSNPGPGVIVDSLEFRTVAASA